MCICYVYLFWPHPNTRPPLQLHQQAEMQLEQQRQMHARMEAERQARAEEERKQMEIRCVHMRHKAS